jgi:hypothetical protein
MEHARERNETRDNEWYMRDGEDKRIQAIRDKMSRLLDDAEVNKEDRKEKLAHMKDEIETILDARDDREQNFIELELERHKQEQELEQQIAEEEQAAAPPAPPNALNFMFRARSSLAAGAEQMRKSIEENRRNLSEEEQFSTILINNSEREEIPNFRNSRRRKKEEAAIPLARIDTIVIKQREVGMLYKESQAQQEMDLGKKKTVIHEVEDNNYDEEFVEDDFEEDFEFKEDE